MKQNPDRWIEYSFSSTLMSVLIIVLLGAYDIGTLIADDVDWFPFVFG